jgi:hypothetical protein
MPLNLYFFLIKKINIAFNLRQNELLGTNLDISRIYNTCIIPKPILKIDYQFYTTNSFFTF